MIFKIIFLISIAILSIQSSPTQCPSPNPILTTLNGNITGTCRNVNVNYELRFKKTRAVISWLSVPYAKPPLRFQHSVPNSKWTRHLDGTDWPKACVQSDTKKIVDQSEDCLYLNIFLPARVFIRKNVTKVPIYIFIHGGALRNGYTSDPLYDPSVRVAASREHIVVTIQYRLGHLGFMYIKDTPATGNQGILDQNLALKWVYDNAERFGGDNQKITIGGQSAGGLSVGYHLLLEKSFPYFKNAILESSGFLEAEMKTLNTPDEAHKNSLKIANESNCLKNSSTNKQIFECLQNHKSLEVFKLAVFDYPPIVNDSEYFKSNSEDLVKKLSINKVNIMVGSNTRDKGYFFKPEMQKENSFTQADFRKDLKSTFSSKLSRYLSSEIKNIENFITKCEQLYTANKNSYSFFNGTHTNYLEYVIQVLSDERYRCTANALSDIYSSIVPNLNVFNYLYGYRMSSYIDRSGNTLKTIPNTKPANYEAIHEDELYMVFGVPLNSKYSASYSKNDRLISEKILELWSNFILYSDPNGLNLTANSTSKWKKYNELAADKSVRSYFQLGKGNSIATSNHQYRVNDKICTFFNT